MAIRSSGIDSRLKSETDPRLESDIDPRLESDIDSRLKSETDPRPDSRLESMNPVPPVTLLLLLQGVDGLDVSPRLAVEVSPVAVVVLTGILLLLPRRSNRYGTMTYIAQRNKMWAMLKNIFKQLPLKPHDLLPKTCSILNLLLQGKHAVPILCNEARKCKNFGKRSAIKSNG